MNIQHRKWEQLLHCYAEVLGKDLPSSSFWTSTQQHTGNWPYFVGALFTIAVLKPSLYLFQWVLKHEFVPAASSHKYLFISLNTVMHKGKHRWSWHSWTCTRSMQHLKLPSLWVIHSETGHVRPYRSENASGNTQFWLPEHSWCTESQNTKGYSKPDLVQTSTVGFFSHFHLCKSSSTR